MRFLPHPHDPERFFYDTMTLCRSSDNPAYRVPDWMGLPEDLDLDLEDTITLTVWLTEKSPKLESKDWEYVKSETRASSAELSYSKPSKKADNFEVDGIKLYFSLKANK